MHAGPADPVQPRGHRGQRARLHPAGAGACGTHPRAASFVKRAEEILLAETGAEDVLLTTSCTSALELSALMLDLQPGDTVVVPSFTFTTTALAFARQGARILFCDIEPETLGLDPEHLETLLDDSVRAVVPVHYAGVACDIDGHPQGARRPARCRGDRGQRARPVRPLARPAARQPRPVRHAELPRDQELRLRRGWRARCVNDAARRRPRPRALRQGHQPARVLARPGRQVLVEGHRLVVRPGRRAGRVPARAARAARRHPGASAATSSSATSRRSRRSPSELGSALPVVPADCEQPTTCSTCCCPTGRPATRCCRACASRASQPTFHYVPLHSSEAGRKFAARPTECPVTDDISGRLLRLPFYNNLTAADSRARRRELVTVLSAARVAVTPVGRRMTSQDRSRPDRSASIQQPDYWWYRARAQPAPGRRSASSSAPRAAARCRQRRRPERGVDARRPPAGTRSTSTLGASSRARVSARAPGAAVRGRDLRRRRRLRRARAL